MAQRIVLSSSMIRVSKPGFDVETAAIQNCLLDVGYRGHQILAHDFLPLTNTGGVPGKGPWSGSKSIGPFSVAPDVTYAFVFASNKQLNPPRFETGILSASAYQTQEFSVTQNTITAKIFGFPGLVGPSPAELIGLTFTVFRRGVIS